jgi:hypothetical protein
MTAVPDERSRRVLEFVASHEQVLVSQIGLLLSIDNDAASDVVTSLTTAGFLRRGHRLAHQLPTVRVTARGLAEIGSDLPVPAVDPRRYWQDLDAAWLWLVANRGAFGKLDRTFTRREMLAADRTIATASTVPASLPEAIRAKADAAAFAIDVPVGSRAHYPELMLVVPQGRIAIRLAGTLPGQAELEATISAYAAKPSMCVLLYLCGRKTVATAAIAAAARVDQSRFTHVQPFNLTAGAR